MFSHSVGISLRLHCAPMWRHCVQFQVWVALRSNEPPNLGRISATLCPLSNAHYIFLSESFYVYFMIDCLHLFWAARSSREEHAKWLIYDCGFLCLTSASTQTHLTGNQFYLLVKPQISFKQTHNLELFIHFQV